MIIYQKFCYKSFLFPFFNGWKSFHFKISGEEVQNPTPLNFYSKKFMPPKYWWNSSLLSYSELDYQIVEKVAPAYPPTHAHAQAHAYAHAHASYEHACAH